jgi:hypothetical protein
MGNDSSNLFEPFRSSASPGARSLSPTRSRDIADGPRAAKSADDLRNTSVQAMDADIDRFTDVTLGQSWVLPSVVSMKKALPESPKTTPLKVSGVLEESFDDFQPYIRVSRSPDARTQYRPNPRDYPMPQTGPPVPKFQHNKPSKTTINPAKSKNSASSTTKNTLQFEGLQLKKTTLSKTEASTIHLPIESRPGSRLSRTDSGEGRAPESKQAPEPVKKKIQQDSKKKAAFFFPTLLGAAPHIQLAPVGINVTDEENYLLYENTDMF